MQLEVQLTPRNTGIIKAQSWLLVVREHLDQAGIECVIGIWPFSRINCTTFVITFTEPGVEDVRDVILNAVQEINARAKLNLALGRADTGLLIPKLNHNKTVLE